MHDYKTSSQELDTKIDLPVEASVEIDAVADAAIEVRSVLLRYGREENLQNYHALAVLEMVKADLLLSFPGLGEVEEES